MALYLSDDEYSDSEIFVLPQSYRHTKGSSAVNNEDNCDDSVILIENNSVSSVLIEEIPNHKQNVVSKLNLSPRANLYVDLTRDDSLLVMEKMVSDLCDREQKATQSMPPDIIVIEDDDQIEGENIELNIASGYNPSDATNFPVPNVSNKRTPSPKITPGKSVAHTKFQTPKTKKAFQHIVSPVRTYIKKSPVVPLINDVRPTKPLVVHSSFDTPIKNALKTNLNHKENFQLPSVAYKAAKETKMIDIPDQGKLPNNQWAKKLVSSIPKATVIKHERREVCLIKPMEAQQEDSFADLSLHQADVSVCTKKSAYSNNNN